MPRHRALPFDWRAADIGRVRARHALRRVFLLLAALTVLALLFSASAGAYVYWANYTSGATIGRANLNGTGANQSFISGASQPEGVAVDAGHIYWANAATNTIGRATLDGGEVNQSFITGANRPDGVAVDAAHIYWTNFNGGTIGRANLNGTGANQSFITGTNGPSGVAVNGAHVYWTNGVPAGTIGRSDLDGENPVQTFIIGTDYPFGLVVDAANIYWTNAGTNTIGRANLDGGSPNPSFISGPSDSYGVAVDSGHIYWGEYEGTGTTIGRAGLAGNLIEPNFITGASGPTGVAVDSLPLSPPPPPLSLSPQSPSPRLPPSNRFTITPRGTCGRSCSAIRVKLTVESAGSLIAEDALAGGRSARDATRSRGRKPRVIRLAQAVTVGASNLNLKLTPSARESLKQGRTLHIKVRFTFTPTGGTANSQDRAFTVKPPKKRR
jgi:virginiamycin B lyase